MGYKFSNVLATYYDVYSSSVLNTDNFCYSRFHVSFIPSPVESALTERLSIHSFIHPAT